MKTLICHPDVVYCEFSPKQYIIRQGETLDYVYYLTGGICYHTFYTSTGNEIINSVRKSDYGLNALLGITMIYTEDRIATGNFISKTTCFCYKIPYKLMKEYICSTPEVADELLHILAKKIQITADKFQVRHEKQAANQLCKWLLENSQSQQNQQIVSEMSSNAAIGRLLGIHKVTVAKILKELKTQGVLIRDGKSIIILDYEQLRSYANGKKLIYGKK